MKYKNTIKKCLSRPTRHLTTFRATGKRKVHGLTELLTKINVDRIQCSSGALHLMNEI
jgi:hypothetical protein